jgi:hypothetical protein
MQSKYHLFKRFFSGISASTILVPQPFGQFPFPYLEKALTFDWSSIGSDMHNAVQDYEGQNERN